MPRQRPHLFTTPARPPAQRPDLDRRATIQLPGELLELPGDQEYLGQFVAAQPSLPGLADAKALGDGGADVVALLQPGGQWRTGFQAGADAEEVQQILAPVIGGGRLGSRHIAVQQTEEGHLLSLPLELGGH